jgi:hypothetical protein
VNRRHLLMTPLLIAVALAVGSSCAKAPPSLSPAGVQVWKLNEVVVSVGTIQHAAIELNKVQICEPAPCRPLLSDQNTRSVIDVVSVTLRTLRAIPQGWPAIVDSALVEITNRLDTFGQQKLKPYIEAVRVLLSALRGP